MEQDNIKLAVFGFGALCTGALWLISRKKKEYRNWACLFTIHLTYQAIKEYERRNSSGDVFSWIYTLGIVASEIFKIGPFHEYASASVILSIRQLNPYLDPYFPPSTSLVRLLVMIWGYRLLFKKVEKSTNVDTNVETTK